MCFAACVCSEHFELFEKKKKRNLSDSILTPKLWTCLELEQEKRNLEGNLHFLHTECFSNPNMGLSSCSDLRGFNIAPCLSETENDNWVVRCTFGSRRWPIMWFDKLILCGSTNWSVSNQRGFERIHEKKKLQEKERERKNPPAWKCFAFDLSWWHHKCLWWSWIQWWILWIGVYSQRGPWSKGPQIGSEPAPIAMKWPNEHFRLQNANFWRS